MLYHLSHRGLSKLRTLKFLIWLIALASTLTAVELQLSSERLSESDLEVAFEDPSKPSVFIARGSLIEVSGLTESVYIPYISEAIDCVVVPIADLLKLLNMDTSAAVLAESYDGYFSVYPSEFTEDFAPYLVLTLGSQPVGNMQIGKSPNLGPYYITYAKQPADGSPELFDPTTKRPFGVNKVTVGDYGSIFAKLYSGPFEHVTVEQAEGRDLFINNCMSCHAWETDGLGGRFSNRTASILSVHARYNADYFKKYVINPTQFIPDVMMPAHPHYTDEKIEAIIAFLKDVPTP
jgi:cytochrome c2